MKSLNIERKKANDALGAGAIVQLGLAATMSSMLSACGGGSSSGVSSSGGSGGSGSGSVGSSVGSGGSLENGNIILTREYSNPSYYQDNADISGLSTGDSLKVTANTAVVNVTDIVEFIATDDTSNVGAVTLNTASAGGTINMTSASGNYFLIGGVGDDTLVAGPGHDVLAGGAGDDTINGGTGNNFLYGGPGDDVLYGSYDGRNYYDGGPGNDYVNFGGINDEFFFHSGLFSTEIGGEKVTNTDTVFGMNNDMGTDIIVFTDGTREIFNITSSLKVTTDSDGYLVTSGNFYFNKPGVYVFPFTVEEESSMTTPDGRIEFASGSYVVRYNDDHQIEPLIIEPFVSYSSIPDSSNFTSFAYGELDSSDNDFFYEAIVFKKVTIDLSKNSWIDNYEVLPSGELVTGGDSGMNYEVKKDESTHLFPTLDDNNQISLFGEEHNIDDYLAEDGNYSFAWFKMGDEMPLESWVLDLSLVEEGDEIVFGMTYDNDLAYFSDIITII